MIHFSVKSGSFSRDVNTAIISLIPKKDKDPTAVSNYHPLSLLNTEIRLFAKVLARRLDTLMTHLMHYDQTGFIKSRLASDNVRRLLHVIEGSASILTPCAVLSVDDEKAFDSLEWHYHWQVLHHIGFGAQYISMIKVLYSSLIARVLIGSTYSDNIFIYRGTRQRCPLSPLLFALSLEPLAQVIRLTHDPITVYNTKHHFSLYADDVLIYVKDISIQLPDLLNTFTLLPVTPTKAPDTKKQKVKDDSPKSVSNDDIVKAVLELTTRFTTLEEKLSSNTNAITEVCSHLKAAEMQVQRNEKEIKGMSEQIANLTDD